MPLNLALEQLCSFENLFWAWRKVVVFCQTSDTWYDETEYRLFELNLRENLLSIASDFAQERYQSATLRPLPQPKRDSAGNITVRQAFWVAIRDQVAWLAYTNVVGPEIDGLMPAWSYGNRLYRSITFGDTDAGKKRMSVGPYRNSRGRTYRPWTQSWPLYRRHVLLTARQMSRSEFVLPEADERLLEAEDDLEPAWRLPYLSREFWTRPMARLHWCALDIEKFYPSISLELACSVLLKRSLLAQAIGPSLLECLASFQIDVKGWSTDELAAMNLSRNEHVCRFVPTGLSVAGFLANAAMLPVDEWVREQVRGRQVAHLRYVDDHIVLAGSMAKLKQWISEYRAVLTRETGCKLNDEKTEPKEFRVYLREGKGSRSARIATALDPEFPSPLMTETLAKISDLAQVEFNLLDPASQRRVLHDLHHLLVTDFPDEEIAEKTRVSFAATLIARLTPRLQHLNGALTRLLLRRCEMAMLIESEHKHLRVLKSRSKEYSTLLRAIEHSQAELRLTNQGVLRLTKALRAAQSKHTERALAVLLRALRVHPEKLRLWERTLDFLRNTGQSPEPILKYVEQLEKKNALAAILVRTKLYQVVSRHCLLAVAQWFAPDLPFEEKYGAIQYLVGATRLSDLLMRDKSHYYETEARHSFSCSLRSALDCVADSSLRELDVALRNEFNLALRKTKREREAQGHLPVADIWRLALDFSAYGIAEHSRILADEVAGLPPVDPTSWRIWSILKRPIPLRALKQLARSMSATNSADEGWMAEMLMSHRKQLAPILEVASNREFKKTARLLSRLRTGWLLLPDWIEWTADDARDPNDPRVSEWTALEIVRLIARSIKPLSGSERRTIATSVFNFRITSAWVQIPETVGWETWRSHLADHSIVKVRRQGPIYDARTDPSVEDISGIDYEFGSVRSLGNMLLSLIRRDFRIPLVRGNAAASGTLGKLAIRHIQNRPCSSRTMAVLEACLMDRSTETFMLSRRGVPKEELEADTAHDVPLINTIDDLEKELVVCQNILVRYQSTVAAHKPRQLIPLYLGQYTRKNWRQIFDGEETHVDAL